MSAKEIADRLVLGTGGRISRGWWVVIACSLIGIYTHGAITYGFTAVFEPIQREFGWSYTEVSLAASLRGMESGILAPVMGLLVDRLGSRKIMLGGTVLFSIGVFVLGLVNSLPMFYLAFALISVGTASLGTTIMFSAVVNWFQKKLTLAISVVTSALAFGGLLVPLVTLLVDGIGWRKAMFVLAAGMLVVGIPLSLLVRKPSAKYAAEAAERPSGHGKQKHSSEIEGVIPAGRILRSSTFWHMAPALTYQMLVMGAVNTHMMPYLSTLDVPRAVSAIVASAVPIMSICGRLGFGWLGDRMNKKMLIAVSFSMLGLGLAFYQFASVGLWFLLPFGLLVGGGWGGSAVMRPAFVVEYFGRKTFGTAHGFVIGLMMLGQIAGAPLAGWVYDSRGAYELIWLILGAAAIPAIIGILTTPRFGNSSNEGYAGVTK